MSFLKIQNLSTEISGKQILNNFSLSIPKGELHVIMGPNGCGKTTLAQVLTGNPDYKILTGNISFKGRNLLEMSADERANFGIFLAFQNPISLPGVGIGLFLKTALNAKHTYLGKPCLDPVQFMKRLKSRAQALNVSDEMLKRAVNVGFSGGERKKLEILQMAFLEPDFCILDEMDAGLDIDALKTLSQGINVMKDENRSFLLITHYQRLLEYLVPDIIHIMIDGKIVKSGDKTLALEVEKNGYDQYR